MKLALVTTPPSARSGIGDYTRHLLPYLRELCDVDAYVRHGHDEEAWGDQPAHPAEALDPRRYDQVLYQLGNEQNHGFMARMVRAIGGTVMQHDWVLFDMAVAAYPALARGGAKGHALALREGGPGQLRVYARNWLDRRRQRLSPAPACDASALQGAILCGWHEPEPDGRWTADAAAFRVPASGVKRVVLDFHQPPQRRVRLLQGGAVLAETQGERVAVAPADGTRPVLTLETTGVLVTPEQRSHGDARRLGCKVRRIAWVDADGEHELDVAEPASLPLLPVTISRDRFLLPLNRSVVRFADAFLVHSRYVAELILRERNARTAIGQVHHGAETRWREGEDRRATRARLGLPPAWRDGFLLVSFGGVQPRKRIDKALEALALARRERPDIRFVVAGSVQEGAPDPRGYAAKLGLADAVLFPGFVAEEAAWDWLHASDVALNLRGPTSGGTSGGIFQAFSLGRPVIASDAAEQVELPETCVVKVPLGGDEVPRVARALVELRDDAGWRARLEHGAREFVRTECHWSLVARRYLEHMEGFPRPHVTRRRLVAMRLGLARIGRPAPTGRAAPSAPSA